jgi:hypothetical protein
MKYRTRIHLPQPFRKTNINPNNTNSHTIPHTSPS